MREFWRRERPDGTPGRTLWTNLHGRRVSTGCTELRTARAWKQNQELVGANPRFAASEKTCLEDAILDLYAELRRRGRRPATLKRAREKLGHYPRLWGKDRKLSTIDARLIAMYIDTRLTEPGKDGTVKRITIRDELAFLRQMLKLARRNGCYPFAIDDVMPIMFETGHKPRRDFVPFASLPRLLGHVTTPHAAHVLFFCVTGGRLADSYRARREDFDTLKWRVTVRGSKTDGSHRTIPVPDFLQPLVQQLLLQSRGEDFLFREWPNINRDLKAACRRAGLNPVSTNGLRRTFGKALRTHGYDLDTISKLFGHTTATLVRDVYADVDGDELAAVVKQQGAKAAYKKRTRKTPNRNK